MSAYGYDSPRRRAARRARHRAAVRRHWRLGVIATLVALAAYAIVSDRITAPANMSEAPHTTYGVTVVPHVAKAPRNAYSVHSRR